jgi:hypothetical protein
VVCSGDQGGLQELLLLRPVPLLLLVFGVAGGGVLGGVFLLLPLAFSVREDGSNRLLSGGEIGGDVQEITRVGRGLVT